MAQEGEQDVATIGLDKFEPYDSATNSLQESTNSNNDSNNVLATEQSQAPHTSATPHVTSR